MMTPAEARVEVAGGVVTLRGELELASLVPIAVALTRTVDGVVDVDDQLTFTVDNRRETRPTWGPVA
jgi:osmotically-inducible protein OsmY